MPSLPRGSCVGEAATDVVLKATLFPFMYALHSNVTSSFLLLIVVCTVVIRLSPIPVVITMDADDVEVDDASPGDDVLDDDSSEEAKAEDLPNAADGRASSRGVDVRRQRRSGGRVGFPSKPRSKVKYAYSL